MLHLIHLTPPSTLSKKDNGYRFECLPGTSLLEHNPFSIESVGLGSLLAKDYASDLVVGGGPQALELVVCLVLDNGSCHPEGPPKCIRQNLDYHIRVHHPTEAYLKTETNLVKITNSIEEASFFRMYVDEDGVLRIGDGTGRVISTKKYYSQPVTLERPEKSISQSFKLQPF